MIFKLSGGNPYCLLRCAHHRQKFGFSQLGRVVCQFVIRGFGVDENLLFQFEIGVVGKQSGEDEIAVVRQEMVEQVGTAVFAERAFRPFGRMVAGDVSPPSISAVWRQSAKTWRRCPNAAHPAMAGMDVFVVFHF